MSNSASVRRFTGPVHIPYIIDLLFLFSNVFDFWKVLEQL